MYKSILLLLVSLTPFSAYAQTDLITALEPVGGGISPPYGSCFV